jgi:hypothetical protein
VLVKHDRNEAGVHQQSFQEGQAHCIVGRHDNPHLMMVARRSAACNHPGGPAPECNGAGGGLTLCSAPRYEDWCV